MNDVMNIILFVNFISNESTSQETYHYTYFW